MQRIIQFNYSCSGFADIPGKLPYLVGLNILLDFSIPRLINLISNFSLFFFSFFCSRKRRNARVETLVRILRVDLVSDFPIFLPIISVLG